MLTCVYSISLLTVLVACLPTQAEQTAIILMPTKMRITMSNGVSLTLEASSWNCANHGLSPAQDGAADAMAVVWALCS